MKNLRKVFAMIIVAIILCSSLACFFSCKGGSAGDILESPIRRLDAPGGLRIEDGALVWNPVEFASRYLVSVDGNETYAEEYRYSLSGVADGEHTFKVRAMGDGVVYESSDYSLEFVANLISGSKAESGYYSEFDDLTKNESFLGYGFDVIRSSVFSDKYVIMSNPIFKTEELMNQRLVKVDSKVTYVDEIESYSIEEFMEEWNVSANVNVSWGKKKIGGSVDVEAAYSGGSQETASKYFHCITFNNQKFYIVMQGDMDSYRNMLTDGFKKDLYSNMEPSKLFELYGTHFITSAVMGGRINSYYLYTSKEEVDFHDVSAKVSVDVRYLAGKTNVGVEGGYRSYAESQNIDIKNTFEVIGGGDFGMYSDSDIQKYYADWEKSLDSHSSLIGIKDSGSLRAIWELIDPALDTEIYTWDYERIDPETNEVIHIEGTGNRAAQLEAFFYAYGLDNYNDLRKTAELPEIVIAESIENIMVNDKGADLRGEYKVFSGAENEIEFSYFPADATNINKSVSLAEDYPFAKINSRGNLVIDYNVAHGTVIELILSAGSVNERIKVVITKTSIVEYVTNWDDYTIDPKPNVEFGRQLTEPDMPVRPGHIFIGWYTSYNFEEDTLYRFGENAVTADIILYAKWERVLYEVSFLNNYDAIESHNAYVRYNDKVIRPEVPSCYGYTFVGWYADSEFKEVFNFDNAILDDTTVYVKWDINKYTITFDSVGGSGVDALTDVEYSAKIERPEDPQMAGYNFIGWFEDISYTDEFDFSTEIVESDMILYAKWGRNIVTIHFETLCGVEVDDRSREQGTAIGELPIPTRVGYVFVSWHTNSSLSADSKVYSETIFNSDSVLYANWAKSSYTVSFDCNGGTCATASKTVVYSETYGTLPEPQRIGYRFVGWYTAKVGGTCISSQSVVDIAANITLYAWWEAQDVSYTVKHYYMNFGEGDYSLLDTEILMGLADSQVAPATKPMIGFATPATKTVTLKANGTTVVEYYYERNLYKLTYNCNGGVAMEPRYYYYDEEIDHSVRTTRHGYDFVSWSGLSKMPAGETTLTANWRIITTFNTTYNGSMTVTDSDSTIKYVYFNITDAWDLNALKNNYRYVKITISFDAKEINKGYQDAYILSNDQISWANVYYGSNGTLKGATGLLKTSNGLETAGTSLGSQTWTISVDTDISNLKNYIYIAFGAHGDGDDDWIVSNVKFTVECHN